MADLAGTYNFSASNPKIDYTVSYTTNRSSKNAVSVSVTVNLSDVTAPDGFVYNIIGYVKVNGVSGRIQTIKSPSKSNWKAFDFTFSTIYLTDIPELSTTLDVTVYLSSSMGINVDTGRKTVDVQAWNTPPYWSNAKICPCFCSYKKGDIIPENTSSLTFCWDPARDDEGDTIYYIAAAYINNHYSSTIAGPITDNTATWTEAGNAREGDTIGLQVYCRNENTGNNSNSIYEQIFTVNKMTAAELRSDSNCLYFGTDCISLTRTDASNTDKNNQFRYHLSCSGLTVYNGDVTNIGRSIKVHICCGNSEASGPYIKKSELLAYLKSMAYRGNLFFTLTTTNYYGTTRSTVCTLPVDLRTSPAKPGIIGFGGAFNLFNKYYYVVNRKGVELNWYACVDPLGNQIYYEVQTSRNGGSWTEQASTLTSTSFTTDTMSLRMEEKLKFRVRARTTYGTYSPWSESAEIPIHYYNKPTIEGLSVDRTDVTKTTTGIIKTHTSIPDLLYNYKITYKNGTQQLEMQSPSTKDSTYNFTYTRVAMKNTDSYEETITLGDSVSTILGEPDPHTTESIFIPRYVPILTIREKGVGVNAVAGDFANLIVRGTTSIYGGDSSSKKTKRQCLIDKHCSGLHACLLK